MDVKELVAINLKKLFEKSKLSGYEFAKKCGISKSNFYQLLKATTEPKISTILQIGAENGVPITFFLREPKPRDGKPKPLITKKSSKKSNPKKAAAPKPKTKKPAKKKAKKADASTGSCMHSAGTTSRKKKSASDKPKKKKETKNCSPKRKKKK